MRNLIFCAFAFKENYNSSVNLSKKSNLVDTYLSNTCVSLISAKLNNPKDDVKLITNNEIPKKYRDLLTNNNIEILFCDYNKFTFSSDYKWSLAFYKLCSLDYALKNLDYDNYLLLDTDTISIKPFAAIWEELDSKILLFDTMKSLESEQCQTLNTEYSDLFNINLKLTNYGGEFIAFNKRIGLKWIEQCERVYNKMVDRGFKTTIGDEFIICSVAADNEGIIKNANPYINRYWTQDYYLVSTNYFYEDICILHLPAEKEGGMLKIFDFYLKNHKMPSLEKIRKFTNLPYRDNLKGYIKKKIKKIIQK